MDSKSDPTTSAQSAAAGASESAQSAQLLSAPTTASTQHDGSKASLKNILAGDPGSGHAEIEARPLGSGSQNLSTSKSASLSQNSTSAHAPPATNTDTTATSIASTSAATANPQSLPPRLAAAAVVVDPSNPIAAAAAATANMSTPGDSTAGDAPPNAQTQTPSSSTKPLYTANPTTTRRNANGSVSSVYSGNKIRHLKKEDGVPLWRKDIQYDFLKYVFEDERKVFHKASDGTYGHSFADIYLDAMAKSSKCSKILKDKLLTERPAALNMAMVCLLVNVGRMNTTLNFFPEMRAQLRTYHSIPSLQAHQDPNAYKQLQDAPRLKSILKGATEDTEQPSTLEDIRSAKIPRTNPVNLIFVLSQYAPKISEMHFDVPRDFFDLVMKETLSSKSRAQAFLWLMWWYLESDFSTNDALENPYGPGRRGREADEREMPIKCPQFDHLTDEQAALENVDPEDEQEFGEAKRQERVSILLQEVMQPVVTGPKRTSKKGTLNNGLSVFSMASETDPASPARDFGSPAPSVMGQGSAKPLKTLPGDMVKEEGYDSDQTRSASPTGSYAQLPPQVLPPKSAPGMRVNALLNDDAPTPPPAAAPATATPAPAPANPSEAVSAKPEKPKGPGRGNWGHRRKEKEALAAAAASAAQNTANANANITPARPAHPSQPMDPESAGGPLASRPHGYYIPLSGNVQEPKRTRPLTVHQQAVERYRMENVNYILDRGLRVEHVKAKRKRVKDVNSMARAWKRCKALPDMYDSEDESTFNGPHHPHQNGHALNVHGHAHGMGGVANGLGMGMGVGMGMGSNGNGALPHAQQEAMAAARALVMLSSLKPCHWEVDDWGEEAANLASGVRKVRRRTERWESGAAVVRKRDAPGGEDVPLQSRDVEYDDEMDVDDGFERSSMPGGSGDEEEEYEEEYGNGRRTSIMA